MPPFRFIALLCLFGSLTFATRAVARENAIDTADPTRIYSGIGVSAGTSHYQNGEFRKELRGSVNWAITTDDMLQIESGYGRHESDITGGDATGLTRTRLFYRQRLPFDNSLTEGFRGMTFQAGLILSGDLKGTDGQTIFSLGTVPSIQISKSFEFYPAVDVINCFDKNFKNYNGMGFDFAPILSYTPDYLWPGAALQIEPGYTQYIFGQFAFGNSRSLKITCGGTLFTTLNWTLSAEGYEGQDLLTYRGDNSAGLKNEWSAAFELLAAF